MERANCSGGDTESHNITRIHIIYKHTETEELQTNNSQRKKKHIPYLLLFMCMWYVCVLCAVCARKTNPRCSPAYYIHAGRVSFWFKSIAWNPLNVFKNTHRSAQTHRHIHSLVRMLLAVDISHGPRVTGLGESFCYRPFMNYKWCFWFVYGKNAPYPPKHRRIQSDWVQWKRFDHSARAATPILCVHSSMFVSVQRVEWSRFYFS